MVLVKVLKRKDASSVLVAALIALVIWQPLMEVSSRPAAKIIGLSGNQYISYAPSGDWKSQYLFPLVWVIVQLVILEVLAWVYVWFTHPVRRRRG